MTWFGYDRLRSRSTIDYPSSAQQLTGDEVSYLPNLLNKFGYCPSCTVSIVFGISKTRQLTTWVDKSFHLLLPKSSIDCLYCFWYFKNTTAYHMGGYKLSSPSTKSSIDRPTNVLQRTNVTTTIFYSKDGRVYIHQSTYIQQQKLSMFIPRYLSKLTMYRQQLSNFKISISAPYKNFRAKMNSKKFDKSLLLHSMEEPNTFTKEL